MEDRDNALRKHVLCLLRGGDAHTDFDTFVARLPFGIVNTNVPGVPYTIWQVVEHMRIAQWDILEFSRSPQHVSPKFPEGYWPRSTDQADESRWRETVEAFRADLREMQNLVAHPNADLLLPFAHGEGQTLLREALLVADHNAYHLGVLVVLKRALEA